MYFAGQDGCIKIRRDTSDFMETTISRDDLNTTLNRFGFDRSEYNIITGDRVDLETTDPRGIAWLPVDTFYAHVSADGALRAYPSFEAAINNNRAQEYALSTFAGDPIEFIARVRDITFEPLGGVTAFTFNSDRAALDATTLGDAFTEQLGQGLISGVGSIDCWFDYHRQISCPTRGVGELPVLLLQILLRFDLGSAFSAYLQLAPKTATGQAVYYEIEGVVTSAGTTVDVEGLIRCSINYVTTGEYRLLIGEPSGYLLKEDDDKIQKDQDLDFLLMEPED